jgi:hypothetical protein
MGVGRSAGCHGFDSSSAEERIAIPSSVSALWTVALTGILGGALGCGRGPRDFEIVAPAFDAARVRFTNYSYAPVGTFADKRGELVPFVDSNGNGGFDQQTEASGRCDQHSRQCWLDHARLRLIMTTTDCSATTGTWLLGNVYDREGRREEATLCDDRGTCSETHRDAFQGVEMVNGATSRSRLVREWLRGISAGRPRVAG